VSTEIKVPELGDFHDVPVIEILVGVGDEVDVETPLLTLESDKATMDVPSPVAGKVEQILVAIGDHVDEGTPIVVVAETAGASASPSGQSQPAAAAPSAAAPAGAAAARASSAGVPGSTGPAPAAAPPAAPAPTRPAYDAQVVVIGAGPGGYTAAFRAADLGLKTILIERYERLGGICLNVGCIPSKAFLHAAKTLSDAEEMGAHGLHFEAPTVDLEALVGWKDEVVVQLTGGLAQLAKRRKVEVVTGVAEFIDPHALRVGDREITFENAIIAAGSRPVKLPFIPDDPRVIDSTGALSPSAIPGRFLVIGGGVIGLEMATVYDALGAEVTVVEMMDQLIPGCDKDLVKPLATRIGKRYAQVLTGTEVKAVTAQDDGLSVEFSNGQTEVYDQILVAVGRVPNGKLLAAEHAGVAVSDRGFIAVDAQQRTNVPHIYAIGDVVGQPMLAHKATHEAKVAAEVIAGVPGAAFDARTVPSVAYTDPEVAWMGLTETAAAAQDVKYEKQVFPWAASGRALGLGRPEGFTKLLFDPESGRLLGAGITGVGAGDLIAETVLALEAGLDAEDIALTIHPHPTLSETVAFAAEMQDRSITDLMPPRKKS